MGAARSVSFILKQRFARYRAGATPFCHSFGVARRRGGLEVQGLAPLAIDCRPFGPETAGAFLAPLPPTAFPASRPAETRCRLRFVCDG